MLKAGYFILLTIFISSCSRPKDLVYRNVQNFSMKTVGLRQSALSMDVSMYNPNKYRMKLKHADMDVFLNDRPLGKMNMTGAYGIPALDTFSLPVVINVDMASALPNIMQLLTSSTVNVKLAGRVKAGRHGVFITIPVNYEGKQDIRSGIKF